MTMNVRFPGLHIIDIDHNSLPAGKESLGVGKTVSKEFGGIGLQKVVGKDVFIGTFHSAEGEPYRESVYIATGEGSSGTDSTIEGRLAAMLGRLGVPGDRIEYLQKYSRQDHMGVFGDDHDFNEWHRSGRKMGVVVPDQGVALFRPTGELALYPRNTGKHRLFVTEGPHSTVADFAIKADHYLTLFKQFLSRWAPASDEG
jgi:hypothetical protein